MPGRRSSSPSLPRLSARRIEFSTTADGPWIDAKSIVKVMAAKVPQGSELHVRAAGDDANDAVAALIGLVQDDFGEAGANAANG